MDIEGPSTVALRAIALLCRAHVQQHGTLRDLIAAYLERVLSSTVIAAVPMLAFTNSSEEERRAAVVTARHR
jgi:hypothetical protein